jgi:hypothetical protein
MKFNDDITMSIASTVKDVLEGKAPVKKEEVQYPHDMYHPETGEKEVAKDEAEHKALSDKGYTHEKNEVAEPEPKGEKEFKAKHVIKKSGENNDGTVTKEDTDLNEEVDQTFGFPSKDKLVKFQSQVKGVKPLGNPNIMKRGGKEYHVMMFKGSVKNIEKAMKLAMSIYDEAVSFKESKEITDEESEKQKKYQAFFQKALKKFGVSSPSELEGDKKKEFFDYIDANYEADNESD